MKPPFHAEAHTVDRGMWCLGLSWITGPAILGRCPQGQGPPTGRGRRICHRAGEKVSWGPRLLQFPPLHPLPSSLLKAHLCNDALGPPYLNSCQRSLKQHRSESLALETSSRERRRWRMSCSRPFFPGLGSPRTPAASLVIWLQFNLGCVCRTDRP